MTRFMRCISCNKGWRDWFLRFVVKFLSSYFIVLIFGISESEWLVISFFFHEFSILLLKILFTYHYFHEHIIIIYNLSVYNAKKLWLHLKIRLIRPIILRQNINPPPLRRQHLLIIIITNNRRRFSF